MIPNMNFCQNQKDLLAFTDNVLFLYRKFPHLKMILFLYHLSREIYLSDRNIVPVPFLLEIYDYERKFVSMTSNFIV